MNKTMNVFNNRKEILKMFNYIIRNGQKTQLYYHKTDGGAEYLTDKYTLCLNGTKEGIFEGATLIIRIDGGELEFICE
jgi:hypothetical protein